MRSGRLWATFLVCACVQAGATPALAVPPENATAGWRVARPEEFVGWVAFDPSQVADRLPSRLRFVTIGELAAGDVPWARALLLESPGNATWGVSFVEVVRAGTFAIDGREPRWPRHGAAALWCARVAAADSTDDLGEGQPFLVLDFWMPDRAYVAHMRERGYFARYGDVRLQREASGGWRGRVRADGLEITLAATPAGSPEGGMGSAGAQAFFPPAGSGLTDVVRFRFAGHRVQRTADVHWLTRGAHPLAGTRMLEPPSFEWGYELEGAPTPK